MLDKDFESIVNKLDTMMQQADGFETKVNAAPISKEQKLFLIEAMKKAKNNELDVKTFMQEVKKWQ